LITLLWYEALFIALLPVIVRTGLTYLRKAREGSLTWFDGTFLLTAAIVAFIDWMIGGRLLLPTVIVDDVVTIGAIAEQDLIGLAMFIFVIGYWLNDLINGYIHTPAPEPARTTTTPR